MHDTAEENFEDWDAFECKSPYFQLDRSKSCIGKRILAYSLRFPVEPALFDALEGQLSYPLGENYPLFHFDLPGRFAATGLLQSQELKIVPRIKAPLLEVCRQVNAHLNAYGEGLCKPPPQGSSESD